MINSIISIDSKSAIPGRDEPVVVSNKHFVNGHNTLPPFPDNMQLALFGLGCFWGAERKFWNTNGVYSTQVGYSGGFTPNPSYQEVCTGRTGHAEVVRVVFNPNHLTYTDLLKIFWQSHNPTQGMAQGNDMGTQYRSTIYTYDRNQQQQAKQTLESYQKQLELAGYNAITTEVTSASDFYYAEDYHQQYLAKNPTGYCGLGGTGVCYS